MATGFHRWLCELFGLALPSRCGGCPAQSRGGDSSERLMLMDLVPGSLKNKSMPSRPIHGPMKNSRRQRVGHHPGGGGFKPRFQPPCHGVQMRRGVGIAIDHDGDATKARDHRHRWMIRKKGPQINPRALRGGVLRCVREVYPADRACPAGLETFLKARRCITPGSRPRV